MLEGTKNNGKENKAYKNGRTQQLRLALAVLRHGARQEVTCEEGTEVSARAGLIQISGGAVL